MAAIASCGYHPDRGSGPVGRGAEALGASTGRWTISACCAARDFGPQEPFMNEERDEAARDFAHALYLTVSLSL